MHNQKHIHHPFHCQCFIIPEKVLRKLSKDKDLSDGERKAFLDAAQFEKEWRNVRDARSSATLVAQKILPSGLTAIPVGPPASVVFDCQNHINLPGVSVANPAASPDMTCRRAYNEANEVAKFFQSVFGRNSIDNAGMTMVSSIHYSVNYNNAFWNGNQMTYGDGDGNIFIDFTQSSDVIAHELTHGVTQFTLGLNYQDEPGGLNESMSDVFGVMFKQWKNNQDVVNANWLIGDNIMGPGALSRGYTCLRDVKIPDGAHCLAKQPKHYSKYLPGMDPHESSGIPNFAFYNAATAIGGYSWATAGQIWYHALNSSSPSPNMSMKQFANRTRSLAGTLFPATKSIKKAVDNAWKIVGL